MIEMFEENINDMETKEMIIPQGWEIDKVKGNKIILKERLPSFLFFIEFGAIAGG